MAIARQAYLVLRRDDGYGDVVALAPTTRHTLGRATTNRVVLKDDLCSREHAEVFVADGRWFVRDLASLNGTRLNGLPVTGDRPLEPQDELQVGRTRLIFVEDVQQLPDLPRRGRKNDDQMSIRKRLGSSRYDKTDAVADTQATVLVTEPGRHKVETDLARLYHLAVRMGQAESTDDLVTAVLDGLMDAVPAEVGAILTLRENRELDLLAYRHRDPKVQTYHKVSQFVSSEVLSSREAILAEDVSQDADLRNRESLAELKASSLICAPIAADGEVQGLIHLYSTGAERRLDGDDLDFTVALARQLGVALRRLGEQSALLAQNRSLRDQLYLDSELVGSSKSIKEIESQVARVAGTQATVLIRGESGVGKELVARAIHFSSPRRTGPFVCLNCAALTETLLESELFGHEKGAFTGATEKMIGKFESADRGTIFLDEIGEMTVGTQAKLLRVLEGQTFERVGGNTPIKVNVRVVAATNQPLEQAVREGKFRRDLFFRLQVVEVRVPPLRDRPDDIPLLAEHFLKRFVRETGRKIKGFTPAAMARLREHNWPGNVRELRNVVERAVALGLGTVLDTDDLWLTSLDLSSGSGSGSSPPFRPRKLEDVEIEHIKRTLDYAEWKKSRAAELLDINRATLDRKIKDHNLEPD